MPPHSGIRDDRVPGKSGQRLDVITNSFAVSHMPNATFHHYDVSFPDKHTNPPKDRYINRPRALEIIEQLQLQNAQLFNPRAVYDGRKNMFRSIPIDVPGGAATFKVYMHGTPDEARRMPKGIEVTITRVAQVNTSLLLPVLRGQARYSPEVLSAITLLNVLVRMQPIMTYPSNARAFFTKEGRDLDLGLGLELWRGFFQSVRPSIDRLTVNVDISTAVMYQGGPLILLVKAFLRIRDNRDLNPSKLDSRQKTKLEGFLKRLLVHSTVPKPKPGKKLRVRPILNLVLKGANDYVFEKQGRDQYPEDMTITEYFWKTHRYKVQLGEAICIGFSEGIVYPMEVLEVREGQIYKKALPPSLAARALKFAMQKPQDRLKAIERSGRVLGYADSDYLRHSGMAIQFSALKTQGRLLAAPGIQFGDRQRPTEPNNGAWNIVGKRLYKAATILAWAVICFDPQLDLHDVAVFAEKQKHTCQGLGMSFSGPRPPILSGKPQANIEDIHKQLEDIRHPVREVFESTTGARIPRFILVILPDSAMDIRIAVKRWGDCVRGCPTQCVRSGKLVSANDQYRNNLALKINAKLAGVNSVPSQDVPAMRWLASLPTMIIGADVSHAAPGSKRPSISGLVSSVDEQAARYVASVGAQQSRVETIENLETMVENAVRKFNQYQVLEHKRDIYPQRIIFYRDGVSEGQFDKVVSGEVSGVKNVLTKILRPLKSPPCKLTFIIVGKRHHQRFFPARQGEGDPKSGNCPAGLVVDTGIVNPVSYDFYLQSHGGLLGTSRSSHYSVIEDENKLDSDLLQGLSYTLCHVYARATRSVSIPAPVYYADLVCARGAFHSSLMSEGGDGSSSNQEPSLEAHREAFQSIAENMAQTMYFV